MKKDKEWLKNEIEIMGSETSENYPHEQMVDRELVLNLIDQLDEPEKLYYIKVSETQYAQWFDEDDLMLVNSEAFAGLFTEQEITKINPNLMFLAVEVRE